MTRIATGVLAAAALILGGCGGGGGGGGGGDGGGSTPTNNPGGTTNTGGTTTPPTFTGFDFSVGQGDFWRFSWDAAHTSFAQGSSPTSGSANGTFEVRLGSPQTIAGVTLYQVQVSGNPAAIVDGDPVTFKPRWQYLGMNNLKLIGSDGTTLTTLFDAQTGKWGGGGFFTSFGATTLVTASSGTLSNNYIADSGAVKAGQAVSQSQCEVILGIQFCGDSSQNFTNFEFYKAGVGPIGYDHSNHFSFSGGGFSSGGTHEYNIGLIASSRRGDTVTSVLEVEPNNTVAQAMLLTLPATVDGAALNETAYGGATFVQTEIEPNNDFANARPLGMPDRVSGSVQQGEAGTPITIGASGGIPQYTTTFEDFYRVAAANVTVNVQLDFPSSSADVDLYVFTLSGSIATPIARSITDNATNRSESLSFFATAGTTYYVAVDSQDAQVPAAYELRVYTGSTPPASRAVVDWFKVVLPTAKALSIAVNGGQTILVANSTGTATLAVGTPVSPGGSASVTTNTLQPGTYLIGLTAGTGAGAYRLTVN